VLADPEVLAGWTAAEAGSVYLHEYLHVWLRHAERFEAMVRSGALVQGDMALWNRAADAEINDNLEEAGCVLPRLHGAPAVTPNLLRLPLHRTAEEYALLLKRAAAEPQPMWSQCGSGAGNPVTGEPAPDDPDSRDPVEQHVQRTAAAEAVVTAVRGVGKVPGRIARVAELLTHPPAPEVPWEELFARAARAAVTSARGVRGYDYDHRSRLQGAVDMLWGSEAPVLPGERRRLAEAAIVADTSGSMSAKDLGTILVVVRDILRTMAGTRVSFLAADAEVQAARRLASAEEAVALLKGGGGTDFRPAFRYLDRARPRPHVVVYATDGYGPAPDQPPRDMHVVWLLVPNGRVPARWGQVVRLKGSK
jgi:predicted metal-dependent peptidase